MEFLTSDGDAPGMNAAIRAVVIAAQKKNVEVLGVKCGYQGLIDGSIYRITPYDVENIADKGGTILKTSRCSEFMEEEGRKKL